MSVLDLPSRELILNHLTDEQVDTQAYVYYSLYQNLDVQHFFNFLLIVNEYDNKYYWNKYLKYIAEDKSIHIYRFRNILEKTQKDLKKNTYFNPIPQELIAEQEIQILYSHIYSTIWNAFRYSECFKHGKNASFKILEIELENFLDDALEWSYHVEGVYYGKVFEEDREIISKFQSFLLTEFDAFWKDWLSRVHYLDYNFELKNEQLKLY